MNVRFRSVRVLAVFLCLLAFSCTASAQFNASIQGTVLDPNGASVAGARINVKNQETGKVYEAASSDSGAYRISGLPPGKYFVVVEASGFKKTETKDVNVNAEQVRGFDVRLEIGTVQQTVTVTATPEGLQTETANIASSLTAKQIERLPQFGRDPYELVRFAPGVFGDLARSGDGRSAGFPNGPGSGTQPTGGPGGSNSSVFQVENQLPLSANGQRISANNYTIDGVSVNSLTWGGAAVVTPNQESVQEVTVLSSTYSAEDGRNSGAQVKVVSKSGSNQFHGSGFFKYDEPGLNAFNKFPGSAQRVENKLRQYGGSVGGPVLKDKLFFFFSYEGVRFINRERFDKFVETAEYRNLILSARPGSLTARVLGQPGIAPRIAQVLPVTCANWISRGEPCAVVAGGLDIGSPTGTTGTYVPSSDFIPAFFQPAGGGLDGIPDLQFVTLDVPNRNRGNQFNSRVDYTWRRQQFAVSTYFTKLKTGGADLGAQSRPMADLKSDRFNPAATVAWISTISSRMTNEARFNFARFGFNEVESNPGVNFGIPRLEIEAMDSLIGDRLRFGANRGDNTPGIFAENTYTFRDVFSWAHASHFLKFGADVTWEQDNDSQIGGARPIFTFRRMWNFANDAPIFEAINADPTTGRGADAGLALRTRTHGLFAQNDWKFRPNLTFNLGLRYEYFTPLRERRGHITNLVLGPPGSELTAARIDVRKQVYDPDRNNFAPRLGFAWSPTRFANKLAVRGGFGMAYNRIHHGILKPIRGNVPFLGRFGLCCGTSGSAQDGFGSPFAGGTIQYAFGTTNAISSFPANTALIQTLNPSTNLPTVGAVEIWGTPPKLPNAYVYTYSLEGEYALPWHFVATAGYQGSSGHKLIRIVNQNFIFTPTNSAIFQTFFPTPDVNSNFHALNTRLVRRFAQGFEFAFSYRWSKSIDTLSSEGPGFGTNQTFPSDLSKERGPSDFDATHQVLFNGLWDLPFLRGRNDWIGRTFGGWRIDTVFQFHSGFPWTPITFASCSSLPTGVVVCPGRPKGVLMPSLGDNDNEAFLRPGGNFPGGGPLFFDVSGGPGVPGIGRNSFRGPRFTNVDLSLAKETRLPKLPLLGEDAKIDFRANFFNAFNKLNLVPFGFSTPSTDVGNATFFGRAQRGLAGRVIEFQARFSF